MTLFVCRDGDAREMVILRAKFHVVSSLLKVLNIAILVPLHSIKSASSVVIMYIHEGLTHIQSQIKPQLVFGESFTLHTG